MTDKPKSVAQLAYEEQQKALQLEQEKYGEKVASMSHRQLAAELNRIKDLSHVGKGFVMGGVDFGDSRIKSRAGLGNMWATVLSVVLDGTKTSEKFDSKRWARKDQINPNGRLNCYPT